MKRIIAFTICALSSISHSQISNPGGGGGGTVPSGTGFYHVTNGATDSSSRDITCGTGCTITNVGGQLKINIIPQIGSLVGVSLGVNPPFNGWTPFLSSDLHRTDITNSPIDPTNVGFQAMYGTRGMDVDASPYINVVDSANQAGTWYSIQPEEDYADAVQIFLTGNEVIEGQNSIINAFTCWNDNGQGDGGDHHLIVYDKATGFAYETYQWQICNGIGKPYSSKVWNMGISADHQNAYGMDSTDAAGLIFSEGMMRYDEVASGTINHAVRFTAPNASRAFYSSGQTFCANVAPATHYSRDKCIGDPTTTPFGLAYGDRLRLKASFDVSGYSPQTQTVLNAYKKYGLFFADTGGFYAQFAQDNRWDFDGVGGLKGLATIKQIPLSNYEKVTVGSDGLYSVDSVDDANGIDSVLFKPYTQTATGSTPPYGVAFPILANPYNRPTINSFTGVCSGGTLSACPIGSALTLTLNDTHAIVHFVDNTPPFSGSTVSVIPAQTTTYTPYSRGIYGFTKGNPITVTMTGPVAPQPSADVATGTYVVPKNVTLSNTLAGSQIRYTLDGTTPNLYSPIFTTPLSVQETTTLKAITGAVSLGYLTSPVSTYTYTLNLPPAGAPAFSVPGGTYLTAQTIGMTSTTAGAPIYYTLNSTQPTNSSSLYSSPITLSPIAGVQTSTQLRAAAIFYGYAKTYTNATYLLGQQEALDGTATGTLGYTTGKFAQALTSIDTNEKVTLPPGFSPLNSTTGYTIGAWLKTTTSAQFSIAFSLNEGQIFIGTIDGEFSGSTTGLEAQVKSGIAINDGSWHFCKVVVDSSGAHPFCDGIAGTSYPGHYEPTIGPGYIGAYDANGHLNWGDGGVIDEVFVKNVPDYSTTVPTSAFTGSETGMWALYHMDNDLSDSTVRSSGPAASSPTFSPAAGAYARPQNVTLSSTTPGAVIHYSTTGTATCSSTVYPGPITVAAGSTVSATTTASGYSCSPVANSAYTFTGPALPTTNLAVRFEAQNSVGSTTTIPAGSGTTTTGTMNAAVVSSVDTVGIYPNRSWDFTANTGTQYATLSTPASYTAGYTACAVFKTDTSVDQYLTSYSGGNGLWFSPTFVGLSRIYLQGEDAFSTTTILNNAWNDVCASYDQVTGAYSFVVNGSAAGSGTKTPGDLTQPINLIFQAVGGTNPFVGKLAGLYIYTTPVGSTDMTAIQAYFHNNFGTH